MATSHKAGARREILFAGPGENARILRNFDWSSTSLGPPESWPIVWRSAVRMMLDAGLPTAVLLGADHLCYFHNDLYLPMTGTKHPRCLGRPGSEVWPEIYDVVEPMFRQVLAEGKPLFRERMRFDLMHDGERTERYFTFTYNPLRHEDGPIDGIYVTCVEMTVSILAQRRLACLRELSMRAFTAETAHAACVAAGDVISSAATEDCPAALLYLVDHEAGTAQLVAAPGLDAAQRASVPACVQLDQGTASERDALSIAQVVATRRSAAVSGLSERIDFPRPAPAIALPILDPGGERVAGVLIGLVTPLRPYEELCDFLQLIATQLSSALANARAKEHAQARTAELAALDQAKSTFLGNISHELRTPLTLLTSPLLQVLAGGRLCPDDHEALEFSRRGAMRLQKLIKSLLDFSRAEAGRADPTFEPVELAAFTRELASMFASAFELACVQLVVVAPTLAQPVYVDREMWEKIVLNLLSNALKFTFEGEVRLTLEQDACAAWLSVSDTGCGIAPEHLPHIFDRFYRVEARRARTYEGSGIGLSLVRELAQLHGGGVSMESELDRGTTIRVYVPLGHAHLPKERVGRARQELTGTFSQLFREETLGWLESTDKSKSLPARSAARGTPDLAVDASAPRAKVGRSNARIVLVDDNADMRAYLRRILGERWTVHSVADGEAARALTLEQKPDLVLADVMMPGLDGFALLAALRADEATAHIPVILVSARAGEEATAHALEAGAADYVVKPFSAGELVARVETQLTHARLQQTERAARSLAERESRARERFMAVLAHELRMPLTAIRGWTELLRTGRLPPSESDRALGVIAHSVGMQQRLVEDLLDVSRMAAGRLTIVEAPIENLAPQIVAVVDSFCLSARDKGVQLESQVEHRAGPLSGDAQRLLQVVSNLLGNALKFTQPGGYVRLTCRPDDDWLVLQVSDTGRGIEPSALPHLFDDFWMGSQLEGRRGGLGLGLAIASTLVTLHRGTLVATSEGSGQGATFTVRLPLVAA